MAQLLKLVLYTFTQRCECGGGRQESDANCGENNDNSGCLCTWSKLFSKKIYKMYRLIAKSTIKLMFIFTYKVSISNTIVAPLSYPWIKIDS